MTILVSWTRHLGAYEELLFASDSRNGGDGRTFDYCPKLMLLPRSDCAVGYAGYTGNAYPLMLQLANAISAYPPALSRALDISELKSHLLKVFDEVATSIGNQATEGPPNDFELLFGGYSWRRKRFCLWRIVHAKKETGFGFVAHPAQYLSLGTYRIQHTTDYTADAIGSIAFAGDKGPEARRNLYALIGRGQHLRTIDGGAKKLDMEPFAVVRDLLLTATRDDTIGGPPQLLKVYQHHNANAISVWWRHPRRLHEPVRRFLLGRPLLGYEHASHWTIDPFTFRLSHEDHSEKPLPAELTLKFARARLLAVLAQRIHGPRAARVLEPHVVAEIKIGLTI